MNEGCHGQRGGAAAESSVGMEMNGTDDSLRSLSVAPGFSTYRLTRAPR